MSISIQDVLVIISTIRDQVNKYHSNNAICQELARVSSRLGIFLNNNVSAIQAKLGNNVIDECFKEIITILNNMKDEINKFEGKGFVKQMFKASKYDQRFKDLCTSLNNAQFLLQTMLVTNVAQNVIDLKDDVIDNCNDVLEKFYNEFFDTLTDGVDKIEKLKGIVELKDDEIKGLLSQIIQNQKIQYDQEQLMRNVINSVEEIKKMTLSNQKIHGAAKLKRAFEFEAEIPIENNQFTIDWNQRIGEGTFGEVYKGQMKTGQQIAIKLLLGVDDSSFRKEIGIMRRVNGIANVIYYYGYSTVINNRSYIAILTEYCPKSLKDVITDPNNGSDPNLIQKWMKYCYQIANGMHSLSVLGILHRDLKAENCLITKDDDILICDFGLAVSSSSFRQMSKGTALATSQRGTVGYISREAFEGKLTEYSDVFAYGILVVYMLFCEYPWKDERGINLRDEIIVDMIGRGKLPDNVSKLNDEYFPELKPEILHIFSACCSADPCDRPKFLQIMSALRNPYKVVPTPQSLMIVSMTLHNGLDDDLVYYRSWKLYYGLLKDLKSSKFNEKVTNTNIVEVTMSFPKMDDSLDSSLVKYYIKIDNRFFLEPSSDETNPEEKRYKVTDNLVVFKFGMQPGAKVTVSAGFGEDCDLLIKEYTFVVQAPHGKVSVFFPPFTELSDDKFFYSINLFRIQDLEDLSKYCDFDEKKVPTNGAKKEEYIKSKFKQLYDQNTHTFDSSASIDDLIVAMLGSQSATENPSNFRIYVNNSPVIGSCIGDIDLCVVEWISNWHTNYTDNSSVRRFDFLRLQRRPTSNSLPCKVILSSVFGIFIWLEADPLNVSDSLLTQLCARCPSFDVLRHIRLEIPEIHKACMEVVCKPKEEDPLISFKIVTSCGIYPVEARQYSLATDVIPAELLQAGYVWYPSYQRNKYYRESIGEKDTFASMGITWDMCICGMLGTKFEEYTYKYFEYERTFVFPLSKEWSDQIFIREYKTKTFSVNLEHDTIYFLKFMWFLSSDHIGNLRVLTNSYLSRSGGTYTLGDDYRTLSECGICKELTLIINLKGISMKGWYYDS